MKCKNSEIIFEAPVIHKDGRIVAHVYNNFQCPECHYCYEWILDKDKNPLIPHQYKHPQHP